MQFGSDNQVGASERVLNALIEANAGHFHSYGGDSWTERAVASLREVFQCDLEAFFVPTGTAANSLSLACLVRPWELILCHEHSHILNDESTAPEFFSGGARMVAISQRSGKLTSRHLDDYFRQAGTEYPHNSRATALSVTQSTENGLVYSPDELGELCKAAHARILRVHLDGARFANAVAAFNCAPADMSWKAGVDIMSLGATKNGAVASEVVLCFDRTLADEFVQRRKRSGHLLSKHRFASAQMLAWLQNGHWLELAAHANQKAQALARNLRAIPGIRIPWPVDANELFVVLPVAMVERLRKAGAEFYEWPLSGLPENERLASGETYVRLVTSFKTSDQEIETFGAIARS